jgi:hypothetical protein
MFMLWFRERIEGFYFSDIIAPKSYGWITKHKGILIDPQVGLSGEPFRRCDCYVEPAGPDKLYRRAQVLVPHSCCGSDIN